jgi:superfamily I DNA/RNA helicase/RecB family exonuclease
VPVIGFKREEPRVAAPVALDPSQQAVVELADGVSAAVLGAPGTGKTTTLVELVADRVQHRGWTPDQLVVLTTSRASATRLRDAIAARLGITTTGPVARTVNSLAFEIVGAAARASGAPVPRLVTGGEQDADIAGLLEGAIENGIGPVWPAELTPDVRRTRRFRAELRDLMARATEFGVTTEALRDFGRTTRRPAWVAAADFIDEYLQVVPVFRENQLDTAELGRFAIRAIESGEAGERVDALRLVIVDDLQEATESTLSLLAALAARGVAVIAFGDPDVAANAFRGGEPDALGRLGQVLGVDAATLVLATAHRQDPALRALTAAVTGRIGTASAGRQRAAEAGRPAGDMPIAVIEAQTPAREWSTIARRLRERHLLDGVSWERLAVIVRSGAQVELVRRSLAHADVPVRTAVGGTALRDEPAVRALLTLVDVGIGRTAMTAALAEELLTGPFGGLDRLGLRRLKLALRAEELAGGRNRPSGELLVDALQAAAGFATIDHRVGRAATRLAETLGELRRSDGTIEELLWLAWERSGLARSWQDQALGSGVTAAEANRNLDGIVALFTAAKRFAERRPSDPPAAFLTTVLDAEVPEDTLSPQPHDDAVLITTPAGAVGLEFDTVVVAGLQDGIWPNPRLRGSMLEPQELVRLVTGVDSSSIDERRQVLGDELRLFALAVSRATEQLVLAAVANDDEAPSVLLSLAPDDAVVLGTDQVPLSLRAITARLRRQLADRRTPAAARSAAAAALAALAEQAVAGADPSQWHGLLEPSSTGPLFDGLPVPVSPSNIESVESSALDWFVESIGGAPGGVAANVGTILHWAMETVPEPDADALWTAVEERWGELLFEAPWLAERQRRIARRLTEALAEYLGDFAGLGKRVIGAEKRFEFTVDDAVVRGSIDRVELSRDGEVVIVDLKTGTPITSQSRTDEHSQLLAYQLAYAEGVLDEALAEHGEHRGGGAKLLFIKEGIGAKLYREAVQAPLEPEQLEQFRERIRGASKLIAAASFDGAIELPMYGYSNRSPLQSMRVRAVSSD